MIKKNMTLINIIQTISLTYKVVEDFWS